MNSYDAIVIGGGPAGSTAALTLVRRGWSVALVEKTTFPRRKVCGEFMSGTSTAVLDAIGFGHVWRKRAGPEIRRLALFSGQRTVDAPMPAGRGGSFGRALGRDVLDALLLDKAREAGVTVLQPAKALALHHGTMEKTVRISIDGAEQSINAPAVIAAHGSWEPGALPTNLAKVNRPGDFLGFKAHFRSADLDADLMPLLFFPGGYGGIVWADDGRLSLSCCVRRDALAQARRVHDCSSASEAVHRHILATCRGARQVIGAARQDGPWLAAGPIRPGVRKAYADDVFRVGNLAGESHPIIAEGISMSIQSGWLLAEALSRVDASTQAGRAAAGQVYTAAWRRQFATRIRVASVLARIAVHPRTAGLAGGLAGLAPAVLTAGAALSGKTKSIAALQSH
ncbi:NAD(P)/FAD-dependent oxidoreductase [Tianweitania sediminis]|uniref:NAD(P)/FAD-dependent oxidoreductase n=1 Tax=Tianweitania sediminis TaxID=1502156 RepID=A0A8J7UKD8_9HYPH|nr:NAD(P)/FAD-dependent oxidoreductase [Tianweitania sediminis]MBP0441048.1 NAD(P)/FAD-dependent oxidoreductase [Tianweitania sediminis]